jgi:ribonuclease HI
VQLHCEFDALPFPNASIDLLLLPHTLELARDPHLTLREVERVLVPEGRLRHHRLQPGQPVGSAPARRPSRQRAGWAWRAGCTCRARASSSATGGCATGCGCSASRSRRGASAATGRRCRSERWLQRFAWMDPLGDRWWPVLGAVYYLCAVKRVRGMRLVGLARREKKLARAAPVVARSGGAWRSRPPTATGAPTADPPAAAAEASPGGRAPEGHVLSAIVIYTDGACKGNPGPGGWGAWLRPASTRRSCSAARKPLTTNNRMELTAVIEGAGGAEAAQPGRALHRQRAYVQGRHHELDPRLEGARLAHRRPQAGEERRPLAAAGRAAQRTEVEWRWVRGHAGDPGNERADALANRGVARRAASAENARGQPGAGASGPQLGAASTAPTGTAGRLARKLCRKARRQRMVRADATVRDSPTPP